MSGPIARLAWRNLWRHRRRTQLLLVVVAYATIAIITFWGFYDGFVSTLLGGQARYLSAPVLVQTRAYADDPDPDHALPSLAFEARLLAVRGVAGAAPRLRFAALASSPYRSQGVMVRGVDPALEAEVSALPGSVRRGRMLERPGEVVLGRGLARQLALRVGARLVLDVQALAGPQRRRLLLVGLIDSGVSAVDDGTVLVDLTDARALTGVDTATGIALDVAQGRETAVARAINSSAALPPGVRAYSVSQLLGGLMQGVKAKRASMIPMVLLLALFAAVTVMSTVIVSVIERTREFGVITALGLSQRQLATLVALEATFTAALGFAIGAAVGYGLERFLSITNLLGPPVKALYGGYLKGIALTDQFVFATQLAYLAWAAVTIALASVLAIVVPGRSLRRLNPAEAMRARP